MWTPGLVPQSLQKHQSIFVWSLYRPEQILPPQPNILTIYQILSRLTIEAAFLRSKLLPR
jgi:hypothetical protein